MIFAIAPSHLSPVTTYVSPFISEPTFPQILALFHRISGVFHKDAVKVNQWEYIS